MFKGRPDADIQKDIMNELKWEPAVNETAIGVIVKDGAVTLIGTVPSYADKTVAKNAAKRINGVRAIADELKVLLPAQMAGSDADIAQRIAHIFDWSVEIPADDVKAEVRNGVVILSGECGWQYQKNEAQRLVEGIRGVKSVVNSISLRKRAVLTNVKQEIEKALRRHADIEAGKVDIEVANGVVTLNGDVESYFEMDLIENAAWSAPGVVSVVDNLYVR